VYRKFFPDEPDKIFFVVENIFCCSLVVWSAGYADDSSSAPGNRLAETMNK
jgi:hypothetical protein